MRPDGRLGVVALVDRLVHGGAERLAADIATRLDPERFASTLCVSRWSHPSHAAAPEVPQRLRETAEAAGVRFVGLSRRATWDVPAWAPLVRLLRSGQVQVVHGHMFGSNVWAVALGRATGVPIVIAHEHSWAFTGDRFRTLVDRNVIGRGSDAVIACSRADRRRMIEVEGIPEATVVLVPNGIVGRAPTPGRNLRGELGIPAGAPVVVSVGALRAEKRFDLLLQAARELADRQPDLRVVIAGAGAERGALEALASRLGLGQRARLLGARDDVPDVLAMADVAVTCSDFEGSPLSVLEYMEAGLPVVATQVGGLPDLIDDRVHGLLVPRREPAALARAIGDLLGDPQRRQAMGAAGRRRRREQFDFGVMVARLEDLYERLYAGRRAAGRLARRP
jgi:glycosyltransferase involved in cell wall biosynthesis